MVRFTIAKDRVTLKINRNMENYQKEIPYWQGEIYRCWLYLSQNNLLEKTQRQKRVEKNCTMYSFKSGGDKNPIHTKIAKQDLPDVSDSDIPVFDVTALIIS